MTSTPVQSHEGIQYFLNPEDSCICEFAHLDALTSKFIQELSRDTTTEILGPGILFRGQANIGHGLLPGIGRKENPEDEKPKFTRKSERNMLHRFRRASYQYCHRVLNEWEALFLAQHHGLPTRLLDWTGNRLVALYNACENEPETDGAIWAMARRDKEDHDLNVFSPSAKFYNDYKYAGECEIAFKGVKMIYPFEISPRMTAQNGRFTIQDDPWTALEHYEPLKYKRKHFDIDQIRKWKVPASQKRHILVRLDQYGINRQTLYPDIDGLAIGIREAETMRRKKTESQT